MLPSYLELQSQPSPKAGALRIFRDYPAGFTCYLLPQMEQESWKSTKLLCLRRRLTGTNPTEQEMTQFCPLVPPEDFLQGIPLNAAPQYQQHPEQDISTPQNNPNQQTVQERIAAGKTQLASTQCSIPAATAVPGLYIGFTTPGRRSPALSLITGSLSS